MERDAPNRPLAAANAVPISRRRRVFVSAREVLRTRGFRDWMAEPAPEEHRPKPVMLRGPFSAASAGHRRMPSCRWIGRRWTQNTFGSSAVLGCAVARLF